MNFSPRITLAYAATLAALALGGIGMGAAVRQLGIYLEKLPVSLRSELATLPTSIGDWRRVGTDHIESEDSVRELGTDKYLTRDYARFGDPARGRIQVHVAYYTGMIDAVPHIPERCMYAAGLVQVRPSEQVELGISFAPEPGMASGPVNRTTGQKYGFKMVEDAVTRQFERVALPIGAPVMRLTAFQNPKLPEAEVDIGYLFIANGLLTPSADGVRLLAFNLTDKHAYYCKVQIAMTYPIGDTSTVELFRKDADDFLSRFIPELMKALPDWPSLEAQEAAERAAHAG